MVDISFSLFIFAIVVCLDLSGELRQNVNYWYRDCCQVLQAYLDAHTYVSLEDMWMPRNIL